MREIAYKQTKKGAIAYAIMTAERCPQWMSSPKAPCDGLAGCLDCLALAADAVLATLKEWAGRAPEGPTEP